MRIIDVLTSPWAIMPDKLSEIAGIYATHLRGDKIDIDQIEARAGETMARKDQGYIVQNGVAIIPIDGVIAKKMNLFTRISGGASTQLVMRDLAQAQADPEVKSALLLIDSPGGTVDGTSDLADAVAKFGETKPIVALADGLMASAAYWVGSAATAVYSANATTVVGSIGVVTTHVDVSAMETMQGVKTTEIYAGKYKRITSEYAPLTSDGRAALQDHVDYLYSIFVESVAKNRRVSVEAVLADMADGRVFVGHRAVDAGLVDGVATQSALIADLAAGKFARKRSAGEHIIDKKQETVIVTTKEQIIAEHPDIAEAFRAEGVASGLAAGVEKGAQQERARIQDVESQALPGHDALITTLKWDGKTTGPEAAVKVLAAERSKNSNMLSTLRQSVTPPVQASIARDEPSDNRSLPVEERAEINWTRDPELREEFRDNKAAYISYLKAEEKGRVRILKAAI